MYELKTDHCLWIRVVKIHHFEHTICIQCFFNQKEQTACKIFLTIYSNYGTLGILRF